MAGGTTHAHTQTNLYHLPHPTLSVTLMNIPPDEAITI